MEYSLLGPTGIRVSRVCLGTATFGVAPDTHEAQLVVDAALDAGINFFDTANVYGSTPTFDRPGTPPAADRESAEEILGRALAGRRDEAIVATKCGERRFDPAAGLSRRYIIQQVDQSLRRLGTDYIDVYYAHFPDPNTPLEQTLAVYDDLVRNGKLRYVALSNFPAWQVADAMWIAADRRGTAPVCVQVKYNLIDRTAEHELGPACGHFGLSIIPYGPLHGGLLADIEVAGREFAGDQRFGGAGFTDHELEIGRAVDRCARDWGLRPYQLSLGWLLSRPAVASVIVGAESVDEVIANATATDVSLDQEQLDALSELHGGYSS